MIKFLEKYLSYAMYGLMLLYMIIAFTYWVRNPELSEMQVFLHHWKLGTTILVVFLIDMLFIVIKHKLK